MQLGGGKIASKNGKKTLQCTQSLNKLVISRVNKRLQACHIADL